MDIHEMPECAYCGNILNDPELHARKCDVKRSRDLEELEAARKVVKAVRTIMEKGDSVGVHADFRAALTAYDLVKDHA